MGRAAPMGLGEVSHTPLRLSRNSNVDSCKLMSTNLPGE